MKTIFRDFIYIYNKQLNVNVENCKFSENLMKNVSNYFDLYFASLIPIILSILTVDFSILMTLRKQIICFQSLLK